MSKKVILAYSGGLDTTTIIPWLKNTYDYEVIAVCVDVGQGTELEGLEERALSSGASKLYIEDVTDEFVEDYVWPALKADAVYEKKYLLGTSLARPLIAKVLVKYALLEGAEAICHGATGKGNDQVRFELTIGALAPQLKIIAPWRIWDIKSREDAMNYCIMHDIKVPMTISNSYSRDKNILHMSHEGLELEDPTLEPQYKKLLQMTTPVEDAPDQAEVVKIEFEQGVPLKLNDKEMTGRELLSELNIIGGRHGVGIVDLIENRVVGMKSRGIYETPGGSILYKAHEELEHMCLDRQTFGFKQQAAVKFAELAYNGEWFTPLREALTAFVDETQKTVTGTVELKLYKGNIILIGVSSPYSLYNAEIASFTTGDLYDHKDAEGFIHLFGLPLKVRALMRMSQEEQEK
ncbi:MAG: argininosuccinate synthase [Eubacteriaceae bacterium]|jgi:argininosuccinate synthase|nr:argininosuccinate synthase [Eubacteriaceae bacterium]MDK2905226.1 argininosuccinate synthase [Eubacteriaceae bacterium]MDK2937090.1 argininosuccinate synthase [Eubacteriaceae bacterium]MDK2962563.1 argininosuccinate synthase [Eubacteriaceae bacterium]MDN5307248.1 argininosuccinate synthase [Eubacteriaceae bacterium]